MTLFSTVNMFQLILFVSVLLNVLSFGKATEYTESIQTASGTLRGEEVEKTGIKFKAFKGIPYAAPPVGELRFKDPQPPATWEDVKDAVEYGHICHQGMRKSHAMNTTRQEDHFWNSQDEDCLTLNVYSKKLGPEVAQAVLVVIPGCTFINGDGTDLRYGPEFLVDQDLVVVTFNYRIGPLGFLATGTEDAPGNWGLKDQVAALKWVQENIAQFGGDPSKVTIFGHGAGSSSAHFHLLSPLSKGLFDKAILSSGTANSARVLTFEQDRFSKRLAKHLGASEEQAEEPAKRVEFLRGVDARNLSISMWKALEHEDFHSSLRFTMPFLPVAEPPETKNYFMTEESLGALAKGNFTKVPIMIGFTSNEGAFDAHMPRFRIPKLLKKLDDNLCAAIPQHLREKIQEKGECEKVAEEIRTLYFGGKSIMDQPKENLINLIGDSVLVHEIDLAQILHAKHSTDGQFVYNYYFTYDGEWNGMKKQLTNFELPGASSGDELLGAVSGDEMFYLFNPRYMKLPLREPSQAGLDTKARMLSFISNFVKTGNPTPAVSDLVPILWEPAQEDKMNTIVIDADIKMEPGVLKERMKFWEDIYDRYDPTEGKE